MPDLLGPANPVPGYDKAVTNRTIQVQPEQTQIQNIADPSRITRADQRAEQQQSQGEGVRYDSNFATFLQRLREASGSLRSMATLLAGRSGTVVLSGLSKGTAQEMAQLMEMLKMDQNQLLDFLTSQFKAGTRFSGPLFALLRGAYDRAASDSVRTDILQFLKSYADYSSTAHIEGNLLRNLEDMMAAMPASWAEKLDELIAQLKNGMAAGDRQGNLQLLQQKLIPFMGQYVERTHDLGRPRDLLSQLVLNLARYENGSETNLLESFHQLTGYGTLREQLGAIDDEALLALLNKSLPDPDSPALQFTSHLLSVASGALRGEGSSEVQQAFQNLMAALLINESVYMPVNHFILPLQWDDRLLFSELWVDPDAEEEGGQRSRPGSSKRFLLKMDIQSLGLFDVILLTQNREVDVQIACPEKVAPFAREIEQAIAQILRNNELTPARIAVRKMDRPVALTEVFPRIFEGMNSVNVKV